MFKLQQIQITANSVYSCEKCQTFQNKQKDEPPVPHNISHIQWLEVDTDLLELYGKNYLTVVHYPSNPFISVDYRANSLLQ